DNALWAINYPNPVAGGPGYGGAIVYQGGSVYVTTSLFDNNPATTLNTDLLLAKLDPASGAQAYGIQWVVTDGMSPATRNGDWTGNGLAVNGAGEAIVAG